MTERLSTHIIENNNDGRPLAVQWLRFCAANAKDVGSVPGLGGSPGEGNGNLLQYSYPENSMDRGAWQTIVNGVLSSSNFSIILLLFQKSAYSHGKRFPQTISLSKYIRKRMKVKVKRTGLP